MNAKEKGHPHNRIFFGWIFRSYRKPRKRACSPQRQVSYLPFPFTRLTAFGDRQEVFDGGGQSKSAAELQKLPASPSLPPLRITLDGRADERARLGD
jgi:hypothetical protein